MSHVHLRPLRAAFGRGETRAPTSLDLGRSTVEVALTPGGVTLPDGRSVAWPAVDRAIAAEHSCFAVLPDGALEPIRAFSGVTSRLVQLAPTAGAPTMLLAGFFMHRVKGTDPMRDTTAKLATVAPLTGHVLDTATGLGYTAIAAARTAAAVTTIELDPAVLEVARRNPWSRELFERPSIRRLLGDAAELVVSLPTAGFERVIHDPPVLSLAGELYGSAFYRELRRVLRPGGRLFHYVGSPSSVGGARVGRGVARRLADAGFVAVRAVPAAFGFTAEAPRR